MWVSGVDIGSNQGNQKVEESLVLPITLHEEVFVGFLVLILDLEAIKAKVDSFLSQNKKTNLGFLSDFQFP